MTEFKQIVGRGTRIREDFDKLYFTILDFKRATELFADPAFDGLPVQIYVPKPGDPPAPPDDVPEDGGDPPYDGTGKASYGCRNVAQGVQRWAVEHGENPNMRIALCGRSLVMPPSWSVHRWTGTLGTDRHYEEVWFSPACLPGGAS